MSNITIPKFTIFYNLPAQESNGFLGTAWEFYKTNDVAKKRYEDLAKEGKYPTLRPFHYGTDIKHMNSADRYWVDKAKQMEE